MTSDSSVYVTALLCARPDKQAELQRELAGLMGPTRNEDGCLRYDLYQQPGQPGQFLFIEQWRSADDLERHLQKPHIQAFIQKSDDLLAGPMQIAQWQPVD
jgi:quinol monooxygenase YgiN